jgi:hypothetical protein
MGSPWRLSGTSSLEESLPMWSFSLTARMGLWEMPAVLSRLLWRMALKPVLEAAG